MPADLVLSSAATDPTLEQVLAALGYTPANDSEVVHLTGNEAITGTKSLKGVLDVERTDGTTSVLLRAYDSQGSGFAESAPKFVQINPSRLSHGGTLVEINGRDSAYVVMASAPDPNPNSGLGSPRLRFVAKWNTSGTVSDCPAEFRAMPTAAGFGYMALAVSDREGLRVHCHENRAPVIQIVSTETLAQLNIEPNWSGRKGVRVKAVSGQTENLFEAADSTGVVDFAVLAGGAVNSKIRSGSADPTTSNFASGMAGWWKNTTSGEIRYWINDSGTMRKSAALT